jgi:NAD(P)-dependent dehydrogenase (short-subunit alcohol dehydrogenase family)
VEAAERLVDRAIEALGGLDVLVNNAGVTLTGPVEETDADAFDRLYRLNVRAAYLCVRRALGKLAEGGHGSIINMTSTHGAAGFAGHAAYAATKGALIAMTRELAIELAPRGIRVNAIGPGVVEVPRYYDIPGYTRELGESLSPLGRVGLPEDVAAGVLYLASDASSFVTGHVLWIDGGVTARMGLFWVREDVPG